MSDLTGLGSIGAAAVNLIGTGLTNRANAKQVQQQLAFQAQQAELQRQFAAQQQQITQEFNAAEALKNRQFQQESQQWAANWDNYMSSTAYQRAMGDMRAAGLNPILAYQQGGASAPPISAMSGSAASSSPASPGGAPSGAHAVMQNALGGAVSTALQGFQLGNAIKATDAEVKKKEAEVGLIGQQAETAAATAKNQFAQALLNQNRAVTEAENPEHVRAQIRALNAQVPLYGAQSASAIANASNQYAQGGLAMARMEGVDLQNRFHRNYGFGDIGRNLSTGEAIAQRLGTSGPGRQLLQSIPGGSAILDVLQ